MTQFILDLGMSSPGFPVALPRWPAPSNALITWRWPAEDQVRVRNLVSRGAMRPIYHFTSWKLGRSVQLESGLEAQVAQQLDACPTVSAYAEQPVVMEFSTPEGVWSRHVPDFAMLQRGVPIFLEVKFTRDVDEHVLQRTQLLKGLLAPLGIDYRLVTEEDLPEPVRLENSWSLLSRGRARIPEVQALLIHEQARANMTLGMLGWGRPTIARQLARLILEGRLSVDMSQRLGPDTLAFTMQQGGGWLWA
ncbi:hypothetical protein J7370_08925 [Xanthomonas sp. D-93]|nr:hypothetical protein [Xanthomonas sp. D-93]MBO9873519.1 hypothetical protein [Xanthomonas sp. D-93]